MDIQKVGKAIAYLRKRAGYTQKDLANRLGISDKAVSKWERGIGLPDIAYFGKLATLLDTDTDSLLAGDVIHHDNRWGGLLVLHENPNGIHAGTMIYDKPLVYFLLGYFLLVGIRDITILCDEASRKYIEKDFGMGNQFGIHITFDMDTLRHSNYMVVFERSFIYGVDQTRFFQRAMMHTDRLTVLSLPRGMRVKQHGLTFDENMRIIDKNHQSQVTTQYDYYSIPVFFCTNKHLAAIMTAGKFSFDVITMFADTYTEVLDRGFVEISLDNWDDVSEVTDFIRIVQKACGMQLYCLEEIAWRRGLISTEELRKFGMDQRESARGKYVLNLIGENM